MAVNYLELFFNLNSCLICSYRELPKVTLFYLLITFLVATATEINKQWIRHFAIHRSLLLSSMGIKRAALSTFFTGRVSIGFLMSSIFDAKCMWGLEKNTFKRHYADFIWMLLLGYVGTLIGCLCVPSYVYIGISMKFMVLYYWTRRNPFFRVSLYMIPLKSTFLPFALLIVEFFMSAEIPWSGIIGVLLGHTYYFCRDIIPVVYQKRRRPIPRLTCAPRFLRHLCEEEHAHQD